MKQTFEHMQITPAWATEVLEEHWRRIEKGKFIQRHMSIGKVSQYAVLMKDGRWKDSPQSIDFDEAGNLINGQHRLEAVRRSGATIWQWVSRGWPVETIDVLDQGRGRSLAALLQMSGVRSSAAIAGTISAICRIAFRGRHPMLSFSQCSYMLNKLGIEDHIAAIANKITAGKQMTSRTIGPLAYYHSVRPKKAQEFADSLFNYEIAKGSAVGSYLKWMDQGGHMRKGHSTDTHLKGFCSCLRAFDENREIAQVRIHVESVQWLADMNPKLRDWIREHITRSGRQELIDLTVRKPNGNGDKK